jgi:hypothetical protein
LRIFKKRERELERDRKMLAGALRAELVAAISIIEGYRRLFTVQAEFYTRYPEKSGKLMVAAVAAPIYKANIARIGALGPSVAADVIMVFSKTNLEIDSEKIPESGGGVLAAVYKNAADVQKDWLADIIHVCERLKSIEYGSPDPGILIEARQRREKAKAA